MKDSYETLKAKYEASQKAAGLAGAVSIERARKIKDLQDSEERMLHEAHDQAKIISKLEAALAWERKVSKSLNDELADAYARDKILFASVAELHSLMLPKGTDDGS